MNCCARAGTLIAAASTKTNAAKRNFRIMTILHVSP